MFKVVIVSKRDLETLFSIFFNSTKFTMDELLKLEHLSLVSKICTELDNHYNMNDKDLAEFIIDLAEKNSSLDDFKKALDENGADFADSFVENILRIIKHMKPKMAGGSKKVEKSEKVSKTKIEKMAESFPFLSIPDKKIKDGKYPQIPLK